MPILRPKLLCCKSDMLEWNTPKMEQDTIDKTDECQYQIYIIDRVTRFVFLG